MKKRVLVHICNECDNEEVQEDAQGFAETDDGIVYSEIGCSLCRQLDKGYTWYIKYEDL